MKMGDIVDYEGKPHVLCWPSDGCKVHYRMRAIPAQVGAYRTSELPMIPVDVAFEAGLKVIQYSK